MALATRLITAEELLRMPNEGGIELIDGEIRKTPPAGGKHGRIAMQVGRSLGNYVETRGLGTTTAAETGFIIRRDPDTVRAPDVAFVRKERWNDPDGYFSGPPDLAIEVISPNDSYSEVDSKVVDWLRAGVELVIVIDPAKRRAIVYRSTSEAVHVEIDGTLEGGTVVPGWTLPLRDVFERV